MRLPFFSLLSAVSVFMQGIPAAMAIDDIAPGQTVLIQGSGAGHDDRQSEGFQNEGTLIFESRDGGWSSTLTLTSGMLTNRPPGLVSIRAGSGGNRYINGDVLNQGIFTIDYRLSLGSGRTFFQKAGRLNLNAEFALEGVRFDYSGGAIAGEPYLINSTLILDPRPTNVVSFRLTGGSSAFEGGIGLAQTVWLNGGGRGSHSYLNASSGFLNQGVLRLESSDGGYESGLTMQSGVLTNTGTLLLGIGAGGERPVNADLINLGLVDVAHGLLLNKSGGFFKNAGRVVVSNGRRMRLVNGGRFEQQGGNLILTNGGFDVEGSTLFLEGGIIEGEPYLISSKLEIADGGTARGTVISAAAGTLDGDINTGLELWVRGDGRASHANTTSALGFRNFGKLRLESRDGGYTSDFTVTDGILTNEMGGVIDINPGAHGERWLRAVLLNRGTLNANHRLTLYKQSARHINRGTFNIAPGIATIVAGLDQEFEQGGGLLNVGGELYLDNIDFFFTGGNIQGDGTIFMVNSHLDVAPAATGTGNFVLAGNNYLNGVLHPGQSVWIQGNGRVGNAVTTVTNLLENGGSIKLESRDGGYHSGLTIENGVLTNNAQGTLAFEAGARGPRVFSGNLVNFGKVLVNEVTDFARNDGTYVNRGEFTIGTNWVLRISGQQQEFEQAAGIFKANGPADFSNIDLRYTGGTLDGDITLISGRFEVGPNGNNPFFVKLFGNGTFQGNLRANQTIWAMGNGRVGTSVIVSEQGFSNGGKILVESRDGGYHSGFTVNNGVLTNLAGGILEFGVGSQGPRAFSANLLNQGAVNINWNTDFAKNGGTYVNAGTVTIAPDRQLGIFGQSQQFQQNAGALNIQGRLALNDGTFVYRGGVITGAVTLVSSKLEIEPGAGPGILDQFGNSRMSGNIRPGQLVLIGGNGQVGTSTLTITNGFSNAGTLRMETRDGGYHTAINITGVMTNVGLFQISSGAGGGKDISADIVNRGEFKANIGANFHKADGVFVNEGQFTIENGSRLQFAGRYAQASGVTRLTGSTLASGSPIQVTGGAITGRGVLEQSVQNNATLSPGSPLGRLTITGSYTQSASGVLEIDLGGLGSETQHDVVTVNGPSKLAGKLRVQLANNFAPAVGNSFDILQAASISGNFSSLDLPLLPAGLSWDIAYTARAVTVKVIATPVGGLKIAGSVKDTAGQAISGAQVIAHSTGQSGLRGEYFESTDFTNLKLARLDRTIDFQWGGGQPAPEVRGDLFSVRWTGQVEPLYTETYTFYTSADNGHRMWINDQLITDRWVDQSPYPAEVSGSIPMVAGQKYNIRVEFFENFGGAEMYLRWSSPRQPKEIIPAARLTPSSLENIQIGESETVAVQTTTDTSGNYQLDVARGPWLVGVNGLPTLGYNEVTPQSVVLSNANVTVNFVAAPFTNNFLRVTATVNPASSGSVSGAGQFAADSTVTLTATPSTAAPWRFVSWTENGLVQSTNASFTFVLSRDRALVANFALPQYPVTAANNPSGGGVVNGAQAYTHGTTATLVASPNFGYRFVNWTENGNVLSADPTLSFTVTGPRSVVANYADANLFHRVTTQTSPEGIATVSGAGQYNNGQSASISAPLSVTNGTTLFTFDRFTLNGGFYGTNASFSKTFTTVDPTNMVFVAEYRGRSLLPLVTRVTPSLPNPVPATTNYTLTFQFDRAMRTAPEPLIVLSNAAIVIQTQVRTGGVWSTTVFANDTYRTPPIAFGAGTDGTHQVKVSAARASDNAELSATNVFEIEVDATAPAIQELTAEPGLVSSRIAWNTAEVATGEVEYGLTTSYGSTTGVNSFRLSHIFDLPNLSPNTVYNYRVIARDVAGNITRSANQTFRTLPDTNGPIVRLVAGPADGDFACVLPVTFAWFADDNATSRDRLVFAYRLDGQAWSTFGAATTFTYTTLAQGPHTFDVKARDLSGNESAAIATSRFIYDPTAPRITNVRVTPSQARAEVSWTTDKPSTSQVEYGTTAALGSLTAVDPRPVTNHTFTVTGLTPNTTYHFRVKSVDQCAHETVSTAATFQTTPAPDLVVTNLATVPTNLVSGGRIVVRWQDQNAGLAATGGSWHDKLTISNRATAKEIFSTFVHVNLDGTALAAGSSRTNEFAVALPDGPAGAGDLTFTVETDVFNTELEQNAANSGESNNRSSLVKNSALKAYPDLTITDATTAPANVQSGVELVVRWKTRNAGTAAVEDNFRDRIVIKNNSTAEVLADALLADAPLPLAVNASIDREFKLRLPEGPRGAGELQIDITVDALASIFEYSAATDAEANNASSSVKIQSALPAYPELAISDIRAPLTAAPGQLMPLVWTISNQGNGPAAGPWADQVFLSSDAVLANATLRATFLFEGTIPAGQSAIVTNFVLIPATLNGNHYFAVRTDAGNSLFELNNANNAAIDDRPVNFVSGLSLSASRYTVSEENAGGAAQITVSRNTDPRNALEVSISSAPAGQLSHPAKVTIPAGESSATFALSALDDNAVEGSHTAQLTVSATAFEPDTEAILIDDNDQPRLTVQVTTGAITENTRGIGVVSRNTATTQALTVTLASGAPDKVTVPATVTIPAGQASVSFDIVALDDNFPSRTTRVSISAAATGFANDPASFDLVDNDVPALTLAFTEQTVSEGAANPATELRVTRPQASTTALTILLESSDATAARVPFKATIPANETSVLVPVTVVDDEAVDGAQPAQISVYSADDLFLTPIDEGHAVAILTVTDDDGPTLKVSLATEIISESGQTTATVSRNTATTTALTVNLSSSDTTEATTPASVLIPAGAASATFIVRGAADGVGDGKQQANIIASASGFTAGQAALQVSDLDLPDLKATRAGLPVSGQTASAITVSWSVSNAGLSTANGPWVDRVYLVTSPAGDSPSFVGQVNRAASLEVGQSYDRSTLIALPQNPGEFYLMVISDADDAVEEGIAKNNTFISTNSIIVAPAYRASVSTDATAVVAGTPVILKGRAFKTSNNDPVPFVQVTVRVGLKGTRRVLSTVTDASGNYQVMFQPLPNEAGHVTVAADHPGVEEDLTQDEFDIFGMRFEQSDLSYRLFPVSTLEAEADLLNLGDLPLTAVTAVAEGIPDFLQVGLTVTNRLAANGAAKLKYAFNVGNVTSALQLRANIKVTSAEGAVARLPFTLTIAPHTPNLVANPGVLYAGMPRGRQTFIEFGVTNVGGASTGPIQLRLPPNPWLSAITPTNAPALAPGEGMKVALSLNPAANLPLERYDGSVVVFGGNASVTVPFQFRAISEARGDLKISVDDDYTYYVAGAPKVADASVTLTDPLTGALIASAVTGTNGVVTFTNVFEGTYQLQVTAERHSTFRGPVTIVPGVLTEHSVFIDRQTVSYRWSVVPTQIEDHYRIVLEPVFEAEVPTPAVTIDNPLIMPLVLPGESTQVEIRLTNHGLIAAERVSIEVPESANFEIKPLIDMVDVLPAKSSISIPILVTAKPEAEPAQFQTIASRLARQSRRTSFTGCEELPKLQAKWSFVCGPDRRWRVNEANIVPVYVEKTCWERIKDHAGEQLGNPKDLVDLPGQAAGAATVLATCLDPCLGTIVGIVGGIATRDAKGAIQAALGFGNCFCPTIPSIGGGGPGGGGPGGGGGISYLSGGAIGGSPDFALPAPIAWPQIGCNPGDTIEGEADITSASATLTPRATVAPGSVCARVRLRIEQEAVVTRAAFLGTLDLDNGHSEIGLSEIKLTIDIRDESQNSVTERFAIRGPELKGLTAVNGTGTLGPSSAGTAKFTFIPNRLAATNGPTVYRIGGTLSYKEGTNLVEVPLLPDTITVFPDPVLHLVYFQQRDVYSDDPHTDEKEPAEPFALGLQVKNTGKGAAINFKITSGQPKIIENEKGLLIDFKIIGTQVENLPASPSLTAELGRIEPAQAKTAIWQMTSTLQGKFVEYNATFEHLDSLGDKHLSLIDSVEVHELIHAVKTDRPGDDEVPDFLVNDEPDADNTPDTLYLSNGTVAPVNQPSNASIDSSNPAQLRLTGSFSSGWNYLKIGQPNPGMRLMRVVRSDGKELRVRDNVWLTDRTFPASQAGARRENMIHLLDFNSTGSYTLHFMVDDPNAPTVMEVAAVSPFVQAAALNSIEVEFSEQIDLSTFTHEDVTLTVNGGSNLITSAVIISHVAGGTYRINGLQALTEADGNYQITVNGAGVKDPAGNIGTGKAHGQWAKSSTGGPVVIGFTAIERLRNTPVSSVTVSFSEALNGATFTRDDLVLRRNNGPNLINSAVTIAAESANTFRIDGLTALTAESGNYVLTIQASGVQDTGGTAGVGLLALSWTADLTPPAFASIERLATNPRSTVVQSLDVIFTEPINPATFDFTDLRLSRNGGPNLITSAVVVEKLSPLPLGEGQGEGVRYRISNFNWVVGQEGTYVLTVDAAAISDLAGNRGNTTISETWVMDINRPSAPSGFAVLPDTGASSADAITATNVLTLTGQLGETNLTVRLFDLTTQTDLETATVIGRTFTKLVTFNTPGTHRIRARAIDSAGNFSDEVFFNIFIDLIGPSATMQAVVPELRTTALATLDLTFSEEIHGATFATNDLVLTREDGANLINSSIRLLFVSNSTYRVSGLEGLTDTAGLYKLTLNLAGINDLAGNPGAGSVSRSWRRLGPNTPPVLSPIPDQFIGPETLLVLTNTAADVDIPAQTLRFSLDVGAPAGATIDATNGVFRWQPSRALAGSTISVTVRVTDNGNPPLSDIKTFKITVIDYLQVEFGSAITPAGEIGFVPMTGYSSAGLKSAMIIFSASTNHLENIAIEPLRPEIASATLSNIGPSRFMLSLSTKTGQSLQGAIELVQLSYRARTNVSSAFVPLRLESVQANKVDGTLIMSVYVEDGRVVLLGAEPLLEAKLQNNLRRLSLYGKPDRTYQLQTKSNLNLNWTDASRVTLTNFLQVLEGPNTGGTIFYRARQVSP